MKIVFFIDHLRHDGTQRVLKQLVEGLAQRGHQQAVVCMDDSRDEDLVRALEAAGAEVRVVGRRPLLTGHGLLALWLWLRHRRFDVAVTLLFISDLFARPLARAGGVARIISSIRARNTNYAPWKRAAVRCTMRWVDRVVVNSAHVRGYAIAHEGAPPNRTLYIPNGVRWSAYQTPIRHVALREKFGLGVERKLIGSVGRLTYQKGFDVLLDALALLPADDVDLLLIGDGEDRGRLLRQAGKLNLADRVHLVGYRNDVPELLGALDLYVHPARFEGMSNALMEAMAAGCPIVATSVDGNRELIVDGESGWLVPPDDALSLAKAISAALADPAERRRRGGAAQVWTASLSEEAMVAAWEQVLRGDE
jgi:glycosyltransferase involved in cell wall biosynthesis